MDARRYGIVYSAGTRNAAALKCAWQNSEQFADILTKFCLNILLTARS